MEDTSLIMGRQARKRGLGLVAIALFAFGAAACQHHSSERLTGSG